MRFSPMQPLYAMLSSGLHDERLRRGRAQAAIEARRPRCGDERVGAFAQFDIDVQFVATHQATRRVHQHAVADAGFGCFGVEALQYPKRPVVAVMHDGAIAAASVVESQVAAPSHPVSSRVESARV